VSSPFQVRTLDGSFPHQASGNVPPCGSASQRLWGNFIHLTFVRPVKCRFAALLLRI